MTADGRPGSEIATGPPAWDLLPPQDAEPLPAVPPEPAGAPRAELATHYEIDLGDAAPSPHPVAVDLVQVREDRLPVIPDSLRGWVNIRRTAVRVGGRHWHIARYHGLRSPVYLLAALAWAVVGVLRVLGRQLRWWWVAEQHALRSGAAASGDSREWMKLHREAKETRRVRGLILAGETAVLALAAVAMWRYAPWWAWALLAALALVLLARAGRPADRRIIGTAVVAPRFRKLNSDIVLRAYYAAKLGDPDKAGQQITFGSTMQRDGEGSRVLIDLPYGKGLDDAVNAKPAIASGLDVTVSQVFLHRDPTSHRRHVLWVADRDPLAVPVGRTPLLSGRVTDIWRPAPLGLDERGQLVTVPLMWNSVLVSALPRAGKTFSARLLGLYAALDPYCKLGVFDAKGSPDWRKFALVADRCAFGLTPTRDGLPAEILRDTLVEVKDDVQARYTRLSELPADVCPEGKLTPELARDPRYRMPVRVLILEEFQEYFDIGDISKEIAALLVFLVKVAPGAGVILVGSTQRPSGIGTGEVARQFTNLRDNFAIRFGLRTSSWQVSELCLGAGAYSEGLDTSTLLPQYKGVGILRGASDASPTVRTYFADGQDAERILVAARAHRKAAGTLSGMTLGEAEPEARDVLADVLAVFGTDTGLQWQILAARLAAQIPDRWADTSPESVSAEVRTAGVPSVDVKAFGKALKGCRRADVENAGRR
jgi:S-DNA-T family DNA segregation ATPase FtsK/SpoIIIE